LDYARIADNVQAEREARKAEEDAYQEHKRKSLAFFERVCAHLAQEIATANDALKEKRFPRFGPIVRVKDRWAIAFPYGSEVKVGVSLMTGAYPSASEICCGMSGASEYSGTQAVFYALREDVSDLKAWRGDGHGMDHFRGERADPGARPEEIAQRVVAAVIRGRFE
jgi:hypothetical protein